jgi:hypothetical protein
MPDRFRYTRTTVSTSVPLPGGLIRVIAIAAVVVVALVVAGCGSSSKKATLSKPQFLARGNAICAQGNQRVVAAEKSLGSHPSQAQITAFATSTFVPDIQSQIDGIRALAAPSAEQASVAKMLDVAQTELDQVKSNPALLAGSSPPFANFAKLAHPYGLTACAPQG